MKKHNFVIATMPRELHFVSYLDLLYSLDRLQRAGWIRRENDNKEPDAFTFSVKPCILSYDIVQDILREINSACMGQNADGYMVIRCVDPINGRKNRRIRFIIMD